MTGQNIATQPTTDKGNGRTHTTTPTNCACGNCIDPFEVPTDIAYAADVEGLLIFSDECPEGPDPTLEVEHAEKSSGEGFTAYRLLA